MVASSAFLESDMMSLPIKTLPHSVEQVAFYTSQVDWKKGVETLGEPLKIKTWAQFYRACGPPVLVRVAALSAAFYLGGSKLCHSNYCRKIRSDTSQHHS